MLNGKKDSLLLCDSSIPLFDEIKVSDGAKEQVMDHVITWTLKQAAFNENNKETILYKYSRQILCRLLGKDESSNSLYFRDVRTILQVPTDINGSCVDFICYVDYIEDGASGIVYLLSEDKYYDKLNNDLHRYRDYIKSQLQPNTELICVVITKINSSDPKSRRFNELCEKHGYKLFHIDQLIDINSEDTESDIFNEFWLRLWG